jgi:hypothetical protein
MQVHTACTRVLADARTITHRHLLLTYPQTRVHRFLPCQTRALVPLRACLSRSSQLIQRPSTFPKYTNPISHITNLHPMFVNPKDPRMFNSNSSARIPGFVHPAFKFQIALRVHDASNVATCCLPASFAVAR